MKTIFKGALAALAIVGASLAMSTPAQANSVGIYAGPGGVSVYYDSYHRQCGYYDRWGYWHAYYGYCGYSSYYRPHYRPYYHRAYYRHSWCWYHPYSWRCRYYRW